MKVVSLNGRWKCKPDFNDIGLVNKWFTRGIYNDSDKDLITIQIPGSYNSLKDFESFEGVFWHFYQFDMPDFDQSSPIDYYVQFKGSNYNTKIWLNDRFIGEHDGGFVPFKFDIKPHIKTKDNFLAVRIDNTRRKGQLPDLTFDWFNWGGIFRSVELLELNKNRIADVTIKTILRSRKECEIKVSYKIIGFISLKWQILDTDFKKIIFEGTVPESVRNGKISFILKNPELWSPNSPSLYLFKAFDNNAVDKKELLFETNFGIRQIEINGPYIYLNKKRIYFKGVSLHEEYLPYGRSIPYEKREEDLKNIKALGLNALRTAHYSHDEDLIIAADKLGVLILEEIPVYWFCDYKNKDTFKLGARMMRSLVKRDINHPSVIWWSVGNEVPIETIECSRFFKHMMKWVRKLDDTRIVTYVSHRTFSDLVRRHADVACINAYFGWYYGTPKMINRALDVFRTPVPNKPWVYTEFGADAKYGFRPGWENAVKFSEEWQYFVIDYTIRTLNAKDWVAGWFIWIYRDFRSLLRQNEYQQGFNRKGLVSGEKNEKKLIYRRIPKIIHEKRRLNGNRIVSILLWIVLFPFAFMLTYILDFFMKIGQQKVIKKGKIKEQKRLKDSSVRLNEM